MGCNRAVLGELQEKDTVMTAVGQEIDVTGDNVSFAVQGIIVAALIGPVNPIEPFPDS